jgi:hypothetical protein
MVVRIIGGKKKAIARAKLSAAIRREKSYTQKIHIPKTGKTTTYVVSNGKRTFIGSEQTSVPTATKQAAQYYAGKYGSAGVQALADDQPRGEANVVTEIDSQQAAGEYAARQAEAQSFDPSKHSRIIRTEDAPAGGITKMSQFEAAKIYQEKGKVGVAESLWLVGKEKFGSREAAAGTFKRIGLTTGAGYVVGRTIALAPGPIKIGGVVGGVGLIGYEIWKSAEEIREAPPGLKTYTFVGEAADIAETYGSFGVGAKIATKQIGKRIAKGTQYEIMPEPAKPGTSIIVKSGKGAELKQEFKIKYDVPSDYGYITETLPTKVTRTIQSRPGTGVDLFKVDKSFTIIEPSGFTPYRTTDVFTGPKYQTTRTITYGESLTPFTPKGRGESFGYERDTQVEFTRGVKIGPGYVVKPAGKDMALVEKIGGGQFYFRKGKPEKIIEVVETGEVYGGVFGVGLPSPIQIRPVKEIIKIKPDLKGPATQFPFAALDQPFKFGTTPKIGTGIGQGSGIKSAFELRQGAADRIGFGQASEFDTDIGFDSDFSQKFDFKFDVKTPGRTITRTAPAEDIVPILTPPPKTPTRRGLPKLPKGKRRTPFLGEFGFKIKPRYMRVASPTAALFNIKATKRQRKREKFTGLELIGLR